MGMVELNKTLTFGTAAGSDILPLPGLMVQGLDLQCEYTVTDAGISAVENVEGWLESIEIFGDNEKLFEIKTNELTPVIALLQAGSMAPNARHIYDGLPTTAEAQRSHFFIPFPHDFGMYDNVYMRIAVQAAATEWGGASAMSATFKVCLHTGPVAESLVVERIPKSTATQHDFIVSKNAVTRGLITGAGANTATRLEIVGKDDEHELKITAHQMMSYKYHDWLGAAAADDTDTTIAFEDVLIQPKGDASPQIMLTLSSTAAVNALLVKVKAQTSHSGNIGEISRGKGKRQFVNLDHAKVYKMR